MAKSSNATALQQKGKKGSSLNVHSTVVSETNRKSSVDNKCWVCNAQHKLWDCPQF